MDESVIKHVAVGLILCFIWYRWSIRSVTGMRKMGRILDRSGINKTGIKSDPEAFVLLRKLVCKKLVSIKINDIAAYFRLMEIVWDSSSPLAKVFSPLFAIFEVFKLLMFWVGIPLLFFFAYSNWLLVLLATTLFFVTLKAIFKLSNFFLASRVLNNQERFDRMYGNSEISIRLDGTGNAVSFPAQWVEAIKLWSSWRQDLVRAAAKTAADDVVASSQRDSR